MSYRFEFRTYQRNFKRPLQTSHGFWSVRKGIILCLTDESGQFSLGEIAPISWLGSESLEAAIDFCCQLPVFLTEEMILSIPTELPACQFGFQSALEIIRQPGDTQNSSLSSLQDVGEANQKKSNLYSGLLPAGEAALQAWQPLWERGYRTFKWKIATGKIEEELTIFDRLTHDLLEKKTAASLRLDANGGLSYDEACEWLQACDNVGVFEEFPLKIEFIEQPLPVIQFEEMLKLCDRYSTPIALDESVVTLNQMQDCYQKGWRGIFVIKPCIVGSPSKLRQFCQSHDIDAVFSSVMETRIGRQFALKLATELSHQNRAMGFGVNHWFEGDEGIWLEHLWKEI